LALKETRTGSSLPAIKKFLGAHPRQYRYINAALRKGVETGFFIKNKGKYKLSAEAKKSKWKKKKKKKKKKKALRKCSDKKIRSPRGTQCRPGPRTPCRNPEKHLKRRKLSQRKTKRGGKVYECVKKKRRRKSKK
jgi:histone H1/5